MQNGPSQRSLALDTLRGMTICFMIIVNTPGFGPTTWAPLHHAAWNGFTPTDLVFPTFMFVVGNALVFSIQKWEGLSTTSVLLKILKRTGIIFLLGYLMYWFPFVHHDGQGGFALNPFSHTRIMGVLQRIALGYFFGALMIRFLKPATALRYAAVLLLVYWLLLLIFKAGQDPYSMLGNTGTQLDMFLFGPDHLYHGEGVPFDPEGVLSTLPAIANVIFGYVAGKWVKERAGTWEGLAKLLLTGTSLIALALLWHTVFPINKKLWTGSFVLLTTGIDCVLLAALVYVTVFLGRTRWTYFFRVFGRNPLFIYLLSELGATLLNFFLVGIPPRSLYSWIYQTIFMPTGNYTGSFLFALSFMLICWLAGYLLDKKKIYIRV